MPMLQTTTPRTRAYIQHSTAAVRDLANELGVSVLVKTKSYIWPVLVSDFVRLSDVRRR